MTDIPLETLHDLMGSWRREGLTPLAAIKGITDYLLNDRLTEQQHEFVGYIRQAALAGIDYWNHPMQYLTLSTQSEPMVWQSVDFQSLIRTHIEFVRKSYDFAPALPEGCNILPYLRQACYIGNLILDIPETLPRVRGNDWLQIAIFILIDPHGPFSYNREYLSVICARLTTETTIDVDVETGLVLPGVFREEPTKLFNPALRLSIPHLVLQQYNSPLDVAPRDDSTLFHFVLTPWRE